MTQEEFFKRYKYDVVDDRIGGGGFGTVYKAYDTTLHREVAIKVSEVKTVNGKTFSLRDEVEALTHVPEHPNIANYEKEKLFTFKMPNGVFDYAVMQYYPDGNLSNAIKQGLTAQQKEDIATQLLEGIAFLHQHKVVHRDLKPGNILIVRDGDRIIPIITDFGLSKAANMGDGSVFTNSIGGGTPRYSSPEQLQGKPLRLNTDLWSYGSILYEIFTGEQLFSASSGAANTAQADMEIYNKIVGGDVCSLGGMPEKWRKVAERCLVVDADKRAKDAAELYYFISGEAQEDETITNTANNNSSSGPPAIKRVQEKRGGESSQSPKPKSNPKGKKVLGIAIALTALVALGAFLLLRQLKAYDKEAFQACKTITDYRAYCNKYGTDATYYVEAMYKIDSLVTDSIQRAEAEATEDNLKNIYDLLVRNGSTGSYEEFLVFFNENDENKRAVYDRLISLGGSGSYEDFLAYANNISSNPTRVGVVDVQQIDQVNVSVEEVAAVPQQQSQPHPQSRNDKEEIITENNLDNLSIDNTITPKPRQEQNAQTPTPNPRAIYQGSNNPQSGGSEGITGQPGDQGNPIGLANVHQYEGNGGSGVLVHLGNRRIKYLPTPPKVETEPEIIKVEIRVDRSGKVVSQRIADGYRSTTSRVNQDIALQLSSSTTFEPDENAPEEQIGSITYTFSY